MNVLKQRLSAALGLLTALLLVSGCTTMNMPGSGNNITRPTITGPVPIMKAQGQVPETMLMDVGIERFGQSLANKKSATRNAELGSTEDIRKAEGHFIPVHLKHTLEQTGHWGAVRVTPGPTDSVDVTVRGKIIESHGYHLSLQVSPIGGDGRRWYTKNYSTDSDKHAYQNVERGKRDAYQNVYNSIANDLLAYRNSLGSRELGRLKTLSKLKWAADISPDAFGDTIGKNIDGTYTIRRLPAEGDPMFERLMAMREREAMVVDLMNEHYQDYYDEMWEPYSNWREFSRDEAENLKEVKAKSRNRKLLGAAVLVGTVAAEVLSGGEVPGALTQIGVIGGIEAIRSGMSIGQEAEMHREALTELGESFGADIEPRVVTIEGKTLELRGTATQQYAQWRNLLRQIYAEETGFPVSDNLGYNSGPSVNYAPPAVGPAPAPVQEEPGGGYTYPAAPTPAPAPAYPEAAPAPAPVYPSSSGGYYPETGEIPEIDPEFNPEIETDGNTGTISIPNREGYRPGVTP